MDCRLWKENLSCNLGCGDPGPRAIGIPLHQQNIYSKSCTPDAQNAQDAQDVNTDSGRDADPAPHLVNSPNALLRPDKVLKRTLRPWRPDAFQC